MANILKFKFGLISFSFAVLILIPLFQTNFNAPVTIKKWQQLNWDDFQGFVKPFSKWGAVISSDVYLEFDSASRKYVAYAGQNNQYSWTTAIAEDSANSAYMLNHEQYHFNITELHARMMNKYLEQNQDKSEDEYLEQLATIRAALNKMQDKYDEETDHSLIRHRQRRWEYQIDSLLREYSAEPRKLTDYYSGVTAFFPIQPNFINGIQNEKAPYRRYDLKKYSMIMTMESYQIDTINVELFEEYIKESFEKDSVEIVSYQKDISKYEYEARMLIKDPALKQMIHYLWGYHENILFRISATYPASEEVSGYEEIVSSFLNSFEIINTDAYWIDRLMKSDASTIVNNIIPGTTKNEDAIDQCATYGKERSYGFSRGPFFSDDGELILVLEIVEHDDSLIYENGIIVENEWYAYQPDSVDHMFFIPAERVPKKPFRLKFGYFLKEDTLKECLEFRYQALQVNPPDVKK